MNFLVIVIKCNSITKSNMDKKVLTVSELNTIIHDGIKVVFPNTFTVSGEISNKRTSNGHSYLNLKDKECMINCIIWRGMNNKLVSQKISFTNGDIVTITGNVDFYAKQGTVTIYVKTLRKELKQGDLFLNYEMLKAKLFEEGYFNDDHKKQIPTYVKNIGIITASDGAALHDILFVLNENNVNFNIFIKNCKVQGKDCASDVVNCIKIMEKKPLDILIIARGGGGLEDIFGFSDENVVKAIYNCSIFTISAIGHEVDNMLSDFVADLRAPTPSIAGQIISNIYTGMCESIQEIYEVCTDNINQKIHNYKHNYDLICSKLINPVNKIDLMLTNDFNIISNYINNLIISNKNLLTVLCNKLEMLNPEKVLHDSLKLNKNHVILMNSSKKIISSVEDIRSIKTSKVFNIIFSDGEIKVKILPIKK